VDAWDPDKGQYPGRFYRAAPAPTVPIPLLDYVKIPAGTFVMGSPPGEVVGWTAAWGETQHTVTLTHDFYMSAYEVTQAKYLALMGYNPSFFTTQDFLTNPIPPDLQRPVDSVSWYDATNYCWQLTQSERAAGRLPQGWEYRLPTEAEWEYACRAGTTTTFTYGPALRSGMANFDGRGEYEGGVGASYNPDGIFLERTTAVGSYEANAFGLYDMHGNVWEWCLDRLGTYPTDYPTESVTDPQGPSTGPGRVTRGGCLVNEAAYCRSATRGIANPAQGANTRGFRPVLAQTL
jgi:formylglycine-generating enzyme required for sulfatase activity